MSAPLRLALYTLVLAVAFAAGLGAGALAGPLLPDGPAGPAEQSAGRGHGGSAGQS